MRDARLNGRYMPLDSQPRDGVSQVSIQGLSLGCSSDSCKRNQCSPPFTCVDLWRVHECRYTHKSVHTKYNCTVEHTDTRLLHIHTCHFDKNAWRHMHLSQFTRHLKPFSAFWPVTFVHSHLNMLWNNLAMTYLSMWGNCAWKASLSR